MSDSSYGGDAPPGGDDDDGDQPPTVIQLPGGAMASFGHGASMDGTINGVPVHIEARQAMPEEAVQAVQLAAQGFFPPEGQAEVNAPAPGHGHLYFDEATNQFLVTADGHTAPIAAAPPSGDDVTLFGGPGGALGRGPRGGNVVLSGGRGAEGGEDGKVIVEGDLHVTGDVVRLQDGISVSIAATPPSSLNISVASPEPRELMRIGADGEVEFGEPITKEELAAMLGVRGPLQGFMNSTSVVLSVVVSELIRTREELERLRSRIG